MSLGLTLAVLGSAFLHAAWNALVKAGGSKLGAMLAVSVAELPIGLLMVWARPAIDPAAIPWVVAAGLTHLLYKTALALAYEHGDLSRAYPIARGTAPLVVALVGAFVLPDAVRAGQYAGIALLGLGILLMARGVFTGAESRRVLPFAVLSAGATATYTLIDGVGARVSGEAVGYVGWVFVAGGVLFPVLVLGWKGVAVVPRSPRDWALGALGSAASCGSYGVSIWAMTLAPIAVVAALRETSVLWAVLLGWWLFGERLDAAKGVAAALIVGGVVLARL